MGESLMNPGNTVVGEPANPSDRPASATVNDPRFEKIFSDPKFAIDPTAPEFSNTQGMKDVLKAKRERKKRARTKTNPALDSEAQHALPKRQKTDVTDVAKSGEDREVSAGGDFAFFKKKKLKKKSQ